MLRLGVIAYAVLLSWSAAQLNPTALPELPAIVSSLGASKVTWYLTFDAASADAATATPGEIANGFLAGVTGTGLGSNEVPYASAYGSQLAAAMRDLDWVGGYQPEVMLGYGAGPVRFFRHQGQPGVVFVNVGLPVDFNTFNSSEIDRARRVVFDMIVPEMTGIAAAFAGTDIHWVGLALVYGTKDFTKDYLPSMGEVVMGVFRVRDVESYGRYALTDWDLVDMGFVFAGSDTRLMSMYR